MRCRQPPRKGIMSTPSNALFRPPSNRLPTASNGLATHPPYTPPRLEGTSGGWKTALPPNRGLQPTKEETSLNPAGPASPEKHCRARAARGARMKVEGEVTSTFCYGNAGPNDVHLLADIVAVDGDIVRWLERRERRRAKISCNVPPEGLNPTWSWL
jgi:hypothetical protein